MYQTDKTRELVDQVMSKSEHVSINHRRSFEVIAESRLYVSLHQDLQNDRRDFLPKNIYSTLLSTLLDSVLQYCFWYGDSSIRPNESSSGKISKIISEAFIRPRSNQSMSNFIKESLRTERFTMLAERESMVDEIFSKFEDDLFRTDLHDAVLSRNVNIFIDFIVINFRSFAGDLFLKRAALAANIFHIKTGCFDNIASVFIPADYQIPNALREFGILEYSNELAQIIDQSKPIIAGSKMEVEIRAATIKAIDEMCAMSDGNISPYQLDGYLFSLRKNLTHHHHLTITTDY